MGMSRDGVQMGAMSCDLFLSRYAIVQRNTDEKSSPRWPSGETFHRGDAWSLDDQADICAADVIAQCGARDLHGLRLNLRGAVIAEHVVARERDARESHGA